MAEDDRIRALEDREEIKELTALYSWHVARAEVDEVLALFTADGRFGSPSARSLSKDELEAFYRTNLVAGDRVPLVQNHLIKLDGDVATGSCTMFTPWSPEGSFCGVYQDRYRRE